MVSVEIFLSLSQLDFIVLLSSTVALVTFYLMPLLPHVWC